MNKNFLIINEDEVDLEEKIQGFLIKKFGEINLSKILIDIDIFNEEDTFRDDLIIEVKFNEYKYNNKVHGELTESIGMILENKGLQPFYIDGKFVSLNVYEWTQGMIIQKAKEVYGIDKDEIYNEFVEFMLTC